MAKLDPLPREPWSRLRALYARSPKLLRLLDLVSSLEASRYAQGLLVWNSMWDLCVAQLPAELPHNGPYLRIALLPGNVLEFRYIDTPQKAKQWSRRVDASDGFRRLELFFDQLHWFVETSHASVRSTVSPAK